MQPKSYIEVVNPVEAMQFTINGDVGREVMDGIVFWLNSGSSSMRAWHNGVHIYVSNMKMKCGDFVVKQKGEYRVYTESDFKQKFRPMEVAPGTIPFETEYSATTKNLIMHLTDHPDMRLRGLRHYDNQEKTYRVMYRHDDDWYDDTSFKTLWTEQGFGKLMSLKILAMDGKDAYKLSAHGEDAATYFKLTERSK